MSKETALPLDFESIYLNRKDKETLLEAASGSVLRKHPAEVEFLVTYGLMAQYALQPDGRSFVITPTGLRYLDYILEQDKRRNEKEMLEKRRYQISISLSVLSLVIAICSVLAQILTQ